MAMTANQKRTALLELKHNATADVLARVPVVNEAGERIRGFQPAGIDRLDFASINRATLQALLQAAYDAGFENGSRYG